MNEPLFSEEFQQLKIFRNDFNSSSETYMSESDKMELSLPHEDGEKFHTTDVLTQEKKVDSPNKSIMKRSDSTSPRKNVNFTSETVVHHYEGAPAEDTVPEHITSIEHEWNEITRASSAEEERPPQPPVHRSSKVLESIFSDSVEVDSSAIQEMKQRNDFSSLSLNEKMDIYLSTKHQYAGQLDAHLNELNEALTHKADHNISNLSRGLMFETEEDNPLEVLSKNCEVERKSSGSSVSSLQSLRDNNRFLESINRSVEAKKIQPEDNSSEQFHDSFNDDTEQMIMNLLKSNQVKEESDTNEQLPEEALGSQEEASRSLEASGSIDVAKLEPKQEIKLDIPVILTKHEFSHDDTESHSIRFHLDSDWKLEDSNDGDREDNDDGKEDVTFLDTVLPPRLVAGSAPMASTDSLYQDASDDFTRHLKKVNVLVDATSPPFSEVRDMNGKNENEKIEANQEHTESNYSNSRSQESEIKSDLSKSDLSKSDLSKSDLSKSDLSKSDDILANSSNIQTDIPLPVFHSNNPFADFSRYGDSSKDTSLEEKKEDLEDILSAENTQPNTPLGYLSIWKSQRRNNSVRKSFDTKKPDKIVDHSFVAPTKQKNLKLVNVVSKRMVSADDDLTITGFLPEISQDSNFEGQFKSLIDLSVNEDTVESVESPVHPITVSPPLNAYPKPPTVRIKGVFNLKNGTSKAAPTATVTKPFNERPVVSSPKTRSAKSKFRVPSFDIKRTSTQLSPWDQYNDIFEDLKEPPTMRAQGMKTLPSMDKDDFNRILNGDYDNSSVKFRQIESREPVVVKSENTFADLQASFHEMESVGNSSVAPNISSRNVSNQSNQTTHTNTADQTNPANQTSHSLTASLVQSLPNRRFSSMKFPSEAFVFQDRLSITSDSTASQRPAKKPDILEENESFFKTPTALAVVVAEISPKKRIKISTPLKKESVLAPVDMNRKVPTKTDLKEMDHQAKLSTVSVPSQACSEVSAPKLSERGKLFVRLVGLKDIKLPELRQRQANYSIVLDNGIHCITTPSLPVNSDRCPINKEFELVVGDKLAFSVTTKTSYKVPNDRLVEVRQRRVVNSKNKIRRLFGSKDIITTTKFVPTQVNDNLRNRIAQDGSFARCVIDLEEYELLCYGRASTFEVVCYNEWEVKGTETKTRVKPYPIATLEVTMLYIPRTNQHEQLPTSINAAHECVQELKREPNLKHEGYMDQEGGDCDVRKRRFFTLEGTTLLAHSEHTHKTRAKINLSNIVEVIYHNKENVRDLMFREFSDLLLMELFKIRFANGELVDFGCSVKSERLHWISVFEKIVYWNKLRSQPWAVLMLNQ